MVMVLVVLVDLMIMVVVVGCDDDDDGLVAYYTLVLLNVYKFCSFINISTD